jgi:3-hydroxyisobutyrate dehydrogenase-like beta-hydroxyacid dehydrogenase
MGELVVEVGDDVGLGEMVKLINNAVAAANAHTLAQALVVGRATGVDLDALTQVMAAGSGGSAMLGLKAGPMREHDYTTLFKLAHMLKDVRLCLEEARAAGVPLEFGEATEAILREADAQGHGDEDFAALLATLEARSGKTL